jgi:ElaB/YqjD/DUF883 family membrane-anchored ribosome-binding protein
LALILSKREETKELRNIEEYVKSLRIDVDKRLTDLKAELDEVQQKAAKKVVERPLLALGVAFAVGMAIGIALANTRD